MKNNKIPKDQLSVDAPFVYKHSWLFGTWQYISGYSERVDTCKFCGCKRHMIKFYSEGRPMTKPSSYERSGISFGAEHKPDCWRAKEPK